MSCIKKIIGAVLLTSALIGSAQASFIEGQLDFVGFAAVDREDGKYLTIDYLIDPIVVSATDDYMASISAGDTVSVIDPINFSTITLPEVIWSIDIFSFSLDSISINDGTTVGGYGMISADGFDDTKGFWSYTSQGEEDGNFAFSATVSVVPEPSVIALMSLGLLGLGFTRRKARN